MLYYNNLGQLLSFDLRNGYYIYASALYTNDNVYKCRYYFSDEGHIFYLNIGEDEITATRTELFKTLALHIEEVFLNNKEKMDGHIKVYQYALSCLSYGHEHYLSVMNEEAKKENASVSANTESEKK